MRIFILTNNRINFVWLQLFEYTRIVVYGYELDVFIKIFGHSLLLLWWPMVFPTFALTPNRHYIIIIILPNRFTGIVNFICPFHPSYREPVSLNAPTRPNCNAYVCFDTRKAARPCQFDLLSSSSVYLWDIHRLRQPAIVVLLLLLLLCQRWL